ncbi:MAG: polyprenyl synthetase family protein [Thermodesulfobacteriota bacterium]
MTKDEFVARCAGEIAAIDQAMRQDLATVSSPLLRQVLEYALFAGGKRVRPLLVVLTARLAGAREPVLAPAMAFEYLHVATLLHDDIIDGAAKRRGRPVASAVWGATPAILAGDYLHARSLFLVGSLGGPACLAAVCGATAAMVEGEFLQLALAGQSLVGETDYRAVIQAKTAALITAACQVGGQLAKAAPEAVAALGRYGQGLGQAFQIIDDCLDYGGEEAVTGKATGTDFLEGKQTLPLILARERAPADDRQRLADLLAADPAARRAALPWVTALIAREGGFAQARQQAATLVAAALADLGTLPPAPERDLLAGLAGYVLSRRH